MPLTPWSSPAWARSQRRGRATTNQTSPLAGLLPHRRRHLLLLPSSDPAFPGSQALELPGAPFHPPAHQERRVRFRVLGRSGIGVWTVRVLSPGMSEFPKNAKPVPPPLALKVKTPRLDWGQDAVAAKGGMGSAGSLECEVHLQSSGLCWGHHGTPIRHPLGGLQRRTLRVFCAMAAMSTAAV